jgi:uncharacterized LabA/DUF88 family protein
MVFVDGGYIRSVFKTLQRTDNILFLNFVSDICSRFSTPSFGTDRISLLPQRVYYYDAIVDRNVDPEKYAESEKYFEKIRRYDYHEVKLGRLIQTGNGYRQKGVDVLMAIDMITKAYENHYEIAVLVAGDDDFVDVVKTVKDSAGKHVFGVYYPPEASERLVDTFDRRFALVKDYLAQFIGT